MFFTANYGACLALVDTTHGPTCAKAFDNALDCESFQCDSCATSAEYQTCASGVDGAICMQYATAEGTACQVELGDAGAGSECFPGMGTASNPDLTFIIGLVCGSGDGGVSPPSDGGGPTHDAGHD
jgi:hypothetical protein